MTFRKIFFWGHLTAGIAAGLLILNASVTGLLLAFEPRIVDWVERGVRRVEPPPSGGKRLSADELASGAKGAAPEGRVAALTVSSDPKASASVQFGREGGTVYVDPYTGRVLGKGSKTHDVLHAVEDWHRWLWAREPGKKITGAACLVFLAMVVSGLILWWPRASSKPLLRYGTRLEGRARDWNWHNVTGFWFSALLLLTTVTGAVMSYDWANDLVFRAFGSQPPPRRPAAGGMKGEKREEPPVPALSPLLAKAEAQLPAWESITLRLPKKAGDPATASIVEASGAGPVRRSSLSLDPATAEVLKWEPYGEFSAGRKARAWVKALHTGEAFGWIGQVLAFLAAGGAVLLVWTGLAMAWRRFFPG